MIDSVLKGTGNSRFLKSAVPAGTSWADALAMLQAGTFPIDFNGINTEGFQQVGTPLNKANLLKDATAAQIGLPPSTTPDGMFQALGNTGELHVWRKTTISQQAGYNLGNIVSGTFWLVSGSDQHVTYQVSASLDVSSDGTIALHSPNTVTINESDSASAANSALKGKFVKRTGQVSWGIPQTIVFIPNSANITKSDQIRTDSYQEVFGYPAGTTTTYPVSTNPNAYQEGEYGKAGYTLGDVKTGTFQIGQGATTIAANRAIIKYGASVSVTDTGTASIASESELTVTSDSNQSAVDKLKGKFFRFSQLPFSSSAFSVGKIYFFPANTVFTKQSSGNWYASKYQTVTSHGKTEPEYTIEYLGKLGDKARVQVVSYVGTGTYGESNPNSLTFDFVPKAIMVRDNDKVNRFLDAIYGMEFAVVDYDSGRFVSMIWNKKTVSWYSDSDNYDQMNSTGVEYYAVAIH